MATVNLKVKCLVHSINIRTGPSTASAVTNKYVMKDQVVDVVEQNDSTRWYRLKDGRGWITGVSTYVKVVGSGSSSTKVPTTPPAINKNPAPPNNIEKKNVLAGVEDRESTGVNESQVGALKVTAKGVSTASGITIPTPNIVTYSLHDRVVQWDSEYLQNQMRTAKKNMNVYTDSDYDAIGDHFLKFNRFRTLFPDTYLNKAIGYVFITKPDLNLYDETNGNKLHPQFANDPLTKMIFQQERKILDSLTYNKDSKLYPHHYNIYLSNQAESFELPDEYIESIEHGETLTGWKMKYAKNVIRSNTAGSFPLTFTEDRKITIYKMLKVWLRYMSSVSRGIVKPRRNYIINKELDYASTAYYFLLEPDGETILFWSKYYGVYPANLPTSSLSWAAGTNVNNPRYSVTFEYAWKEDFDPMILAEFNFNSFGDDMSAANVKYAKVYEPSIVNAGTTMVGVPFIETVKATSTSPPVFKLRYKKL